MIGVSYQFSGRQYRREWSQTRLTHLYDFTCRHVYSADYSLHRIPDCHMFREFEHGRGMTTRARWSMWARESQASPDTCEQYLIVQVLECQRKTKHPWEDCVCCHPRENARRRDVTKFRSEFETPDNKPCTSTARKLP